MNDLFQTGALSGSPSNVFVHPDWNPFNIRYDADIAALTTEDEIPYTKYIRPICLSRTVMGAEEGYVAGWGESEDKSKVHENLPKQIKIPIHANEFCFLESVEFSKISSTRTFCGGGRNMIGPCRGDSGGGVFVRIGNAFYLKGLVSASLTNLGECDVTNFALYTNVEKFIDWIEQPTEELSVANRPSEQSYSKPSYTQQPYFTRSTNRPSPPSYTKAPSYAGNRPSSVTKPGTCGIMSSSQSLIQGGRQSSRENFPWTVATYIQGTYFSTGTLISDKHIISTGLSVASLDSISQRYVARNPSEFKMIFGVSNLDDAGVSGFTIDGAAAVIVHPSIRHGYPRIANVGIIVLRNRVRFNQYVSPACLPIEAIEVDEYEGRNAFAVGWGQTNTGFDSKVKNYAAVKIRSQSDCEYFWNENLRQTGSSRFFCAGGDGRESACYRDQPLYLKSEGRWVLRGLIAIAHDTPDNKCDLRQPVLYEDIGQYYNWIKTIIR